MYKFSAVDGFVEISECLGDMIKYLANEPSVGLYFIQQHAQNAVPNIVHLKNTVLEKSHESILHGEDMEDSIIAVKSMKECGFPIAEEMIRDIKRSLAIMSTKQPNRGLIQPTSSGFWTGSSSSSSWKPTTWSRSSVNIRGNSEKTVGYLSNVFKTAKQKAGNLKWSQLDLRELDQIAGEGTSSFPDSSIPVSAQQTTSTRREYEASKPPESNSEHKPKEVGDASGDDKRSYSYDNFKADREAKLEEWLKDIGNMDQDRTTQTKQLQL